MGPLSVEAAGLMWGHVAVAGPGSGGGLGASHLPPWGLWGAAGSCGALRLLPAGTLGSCGSGGIVAPAALGDFGLDVNRGLILFPRSERPYLNPRSIGIF